MPGWSGGAYSTGQLGARTVLDPGNAAHNELLIGDLGWAPKLTWCYLDSTTLFIEISYAQCP